VKKNQCIKNEGFSEKRKNAELVVSIKSVGRGPLGVNIVGEGGAPLEGLKHFLFIQGHQGLPLKGKLSSLGGETCRRWKGEFQKEQVIPREEESSCVGESSNHLSCTGREKDHEEGGLKRGEGIPGTFLIPVKEE